MHRYLCCMIGVVLFVSGFSSAAWHPVEDRIMTRWAEEVTVHNVLPEYPRPAMVRLAWLNLNGLWEYAIVHKDAVKLDFWEGAILVPFPAESALSGVGKPVGAQKALWYKRQLSVPDAWRSQRLLLHFGAVDWECTVWVNGQVVGSHKGGYNPFTFDITEALNPGAVQDLVVRVWDPSDENNSPIPRGKQVTRPEGIWYTPVTGIWQTVWLEPVPKACIQSLKVTPDLDRGQVTIEVGIEGANPQTHMADKYFLWISASDGKTTVASAMGHLFKPLTLTLDTVKEWSPDSPFLYDLTVRLTQEGSTVDSVSSYFGMRKIEVKKDEQGINRLFLNNKPIFQFGLLDQGWWPDGLYTAPTDEALRYDVEMTKAWGFNMLRKHVKVEPQRLYYWCDKLGVLVWQDMPSAGFDRLPYSADQLKQFDAQWEAEWKAIIDALYHHPSIVMWVPFNEGWGQYDTERISEWTKGYDPSRLVNNASGWTDKGVGDVHDIHSYPNPAMPGLEENRAVVLGEYGGLGLPIRGHLWEDGGNWGYQTYQDMGEYEQRYIRMTQDLFGLMYKGLAAAVYTQTTDVEVEVNGLMTYDRKVIKLDPKRFASVNQGFSPPMFADEMDIFANSMQVVLSARKDPQIRYTLDGSDPTNSSPLYTQPFLIDRTTTVKARCFWPDGKASLTVSREFRKVPLVKAVKPEIQGEGLKYAGYEGQWNVLPDFSSLTAVQTGVARGLDLSVMPRQENFGLVFSGYVNVPQSGVYQFWLNSDDGSQLFLAGRELINNDGVHGMIEVSGAMVLEAGWHPIEIRYFQGVGGLGLELYWKGPDFGRTRLRGRSLGY